MALTSIVVTGIFLSPFLASMIRARIAKFMLAKSDHVAFQMGWNTT